MTPNFANKVLNAEIPPPDSAWDKIAAELDKMEGSGFVNKLAQASIDPPASVWGRIANALEDSGSARVFFLKRNWIRWTAAAVVIGIMTFGAITFFNSGKSSNLISSKDNTQPSTNPTPTPQSNTSDASSSSGGTTLTPNTRIAENLNQSISRKKFPGNPRPSQVPLRHAVIESTGSANGNAMPPDNEPVKSNNVSSNQANFIPAPEYYVVTAPNGERVRISSKFSDAVTSLYGGDNVDYFWKSRFDSWKSKLMTNPSFIPSAGNFLDIAELKDLLKEQ